MVTSSRLAKSTAAAAFANKDLTTPGLLLREAAGDWGSDGLWDPGAATVTAIDLIFAPLTGQERLTLPEGLRDEDARKLYLLDDFRALRYGEADGDRIVQGKLGPATAVFTGASLEAARTALDAYAVANPEWLATYRADAGLLAQLTAAGALLYLFQEPVSQDWREQDIYRVRTANRWGAFTEVLATRQDPGNN